MHNIFSPPVGNGKIVPHSGQNLGSESNADILPLTKNYLQYQKAT